MKYIMRIDDLIAIGGRYVPLRLEEDNSLYCSGLYRLSYRDMTIEAIVDIYRSGARLVRYSDEDKHEFYDAVFEELSKRAGQNRFSKEQWIHAACMFIYNAMFLVYMLIPIILLARSIMSGNSLNLSGVSLIISVAVYYSIGFIVRRMTLYMVHGIGSLPNNDAAVLRRSVCDAKAE